MLLQGSKYQYKNIGHLFFICFHLFNIFLFQTSARIGIPHLKWLSGGEYTLMAIDVLGRTTATKVLS
jgi:hypothetical protein